jgi:hypothetical protein
MYTIWKINNTRKINSTGLVLEVFYEVRVFTGDFFINKISSIILDENDELEDFIPFEDLTESIIIAWVKDKIGNEAIETLESSLKNKLRTNIRKNIKINGQFSKGLPWKKNN